MHHQQQQQQHLRASVDESLHSLADTRLILKRQFSSPHASNPSTLTCRKKQRAPSQPQVPPVCQVEGCHRDLVDFKGYYRRHRVCELHSKTPKSIVDGIEQRFCQQCSRFHVLKEFDDGKRSCRKRLAGHNERRRKPPVSAEHALSFPGSLFSPGDFKPFMIQQQQVAVQQRQHLLDGSFLCSWPESSSSKSASPAMNAQPLHLQRQSQLQISGAHETSAQQRQEQMIFEFLKSHAAGLVPPLTGFNPGSSPPPTVPPCAAVALGAVHGGALSLLSAGQSSSSPNLSAVSAGSDDHPPPRLSSTAATATSTGRNSDNMNSSSRGFFTVNPPISIDTEGLYKRPVRQVDSIMQITQPGTTTTSALDMLVYSRSEY